MPKLPDVSGKEARRALERLGFVFKRQSGSHVIMRRGSRGCVVPMHREINRGTLKGILEQAGGERRRIHDGVMMLAKPKRSKTS